MENEEIPRSYDEFAKDLAQIVKEARSCGIDIVLLMRESSMFTQGTRVSFSRNCDDIIAYGLIQFGYETIGAAERMEEE